MIRSSISSNRSSTRERRFYRRMGDATARRSERPRTPPPGHKLIIEGSAVIPFCEGNEVFYNKVQEFNRDLSIAVIRHFSEVRLRERAEKQLKRERRAAEQTFCDDDRRALDAVNWGARAAKTAATDGLHVLDALAATALRSVRYLKEIPGVRCVTVNDLDEAAVEAAQRNMDFNGVAPARAHVRRGDATMVMYESREAADDADKFDVIDLDPYGSCAPFIDAAVQSVVDGGLLCVTSTDLGVLSGGHPEICYSKYGSMPTRAAHLHEMALRIVLHTLETTANRYKRHVEPLLAVSADFYLRLFVRIRVSPAEVQRGCLRSALVLQSVQCASFHLVPMGRLGGRNGNTWQPGVFGGAGVCPQTGGGMRIGGPIWSDPIHNQPFVRGLLAKLKACEKGGGDAKAGCGSGGGVKTGGGSSGSNGVSRDSGGASSGGGWTQPGTHKRIVGLLSSVMDELPDVPLYYTVPNICETLRCTMPKQVELFAALVNAGYRVSSQHREPTAIKTNAPDDVVWDIMRCWVKKHPVAPKRQAAEETPGQIIMRREPVLDANFSVPSQLRAQYAAAHAAPRFPQNPEPNWGPKSRATGKKRGREESPAGAGGSGGSGGSAGGDKTPNGKQPAESASPVAAAGGKTTASGAAAPPGVAEAVVPAAAKGAAAAAGAAGTANAEGTAASVGSGAEGGGDGAALENGASGVTT
ncbi:unnamed protein product [Phaeothamnion confervicola]